MDRAIICVVAKNTEGHFMSDGTAIEIHSVLALKYNSRWLEDSNDGQFDEKLMIRSSSPAPSRSAPSPTGNSKELTVPVQHEDVKPGDQNSSIGDSFHRANEPKTMIGLSNRHQKDGCHSNTIARWKISVLGFVSILVLVLAAIIVTCIQNPGDDDYSLPLLQDPIQLEGSPLTVNMHAANSGFQIYSGTSSDHDFGDEQLHFLIDLLFPIVSQISEREGYQHTDYIASRRNDESIVLKGSPQHNALAWLSHAIICHRNTDGSGGSSSNSSPYEHFSKPANEKEINNEYEYDCASLLSRSQLINRYALATMYFAWNGKSWQKSQGWMSYYSGREDPASSLMSRNSMDSIWNAQTSIDVDSRRQPSDICLWEGVTCRHDLLLENAGLIGETNITVGNEPSIEDQSEAEGGEQIVGLHLSGKNLVGYMSEVKEIRLLAHLEDLDLSGNHLEGLVPNDLGRLEELRSLDLSQNLLSGTLPTLIPKNLTRLEVLRLEENFLVGGLDGFRFAPPCKEAPWKDFSADCSWTKPKVECPCCTKCCGDNADLEPGNLRGTSREKTKTKKGIENSVCQGHLPESLSAATNTTFVTIGMETDDVV